jgi:hypothetical protein
VPPFLQDIVCFFVVGFVVAFFVVVVAPAAEENRANRHITATVI